MRQCWSERSCLVTVAASGLRRSDDVDSAWSRDSRGVPGRSTRHHAHVLTSSDPPPQWVTAALEEYKSLRVEIIDAVQTQRQIMQIWLTGSSVLIGLGLQDVNPLLAVLSSRIEISCSHGGIVEPVTCDDVNYGGFVTSFRLLILALLVPAVTTFITTGSAW
jgi:hypothetical protein